MYRATILFLIANDSFCQNIYERYKSKIPTTLPKYEYNGGSLNIPFEENSQELFEAIEIIKEKGYTPRLFSEAYYTKKEIEDKVGYFELSPSYPTELEGTTEKSYGTVLDGGCPCCGVGNVAVGDVLIDRKLMKKCKIGCLIPDYVVSKEVKEIIENNGLTGVTFEKKVKDFKNREMDDFYVMNIKNILPPMSKTTWLNEQELEDGCKICGYRTTYLESDIQYESEKLDNAFDFNLTKEYVNNDWNRYLVVSAKVRKVFKENKIRVGFKPVTLL